MFKIDRMYKILRRMLGIQQVPSSGEGEVGKEQKKLQTRASWANLTLAPLLDFLSFSCISETDI